jgi:flagellar assembly factor FliW
MAITIDKRTQDPALDVTPNSTGLPAQTLTVPTTRFGTIEVEEEIIVTLPEGIIGFEQWKRYVIIRHDEQTSFRWFQAIDTPEVAFPILEPREFRPDYAPTVSEADARMLGITAETPVLLFAVITVPPSNPQEMTANLLGPILINGFTRIGKQVIVQDEEYSTRHRIVDELERAQKVAPVACVAMPNREPSAKAHRPKAQVVA